MFVKRAPQPIRNDAHQERFHWRSFMGFAPVDPNDTAANSEIPVARGAEWPRRC